MIANTYLDERDLKRPHTESKLKFSSTNINVDLQKVYAELQTNVEYTSDTKNDPYCTYES